MEVTTQAPGAFVGRYPVECECGIVLSDGTVAQLRPIRPDDGVALAGFHDDLSPDTVYRRFFTAHPHLRAQEIEHFTHVDYRDRLALVVEMDGRLVAVARYDRGPGSDEAEVAFVVADAHQGLGLGTLLLEHLAAAARRRGTTRFVAQTLASNSTMQAVFGQAGFCCERHRSQGVADVSFPIAVTGSYLDAVLTREVSAMHNWLQRSMATPRPARLGLVCGSGRRAGLVAGAADSLGGEAAALITLGAGPPVDGYAGLAYLAGDPVTAVIGIDALGSRRDQRFLALARYVAQRKPLVALDAGGDVDEVWEQAGVQRVRDTDEMAAACRRLLAAREEGAWHPADPGKLPELTGCDPRAARSILDAEQLRASDQWRQLDPAAVVALLGAYGVVDDRTRAAGRLTPGLVLTIGAEPGVGLVARTRSEVAAGPSHRRLLPVTDQDAATLAGPTVADPAPAIEVVLRMARLIDDQPDLRRVEVRLGSTSSVATIPARAWVGQIRGASHDPTVRALAVTP